MADPSLGLLLARFEAAVLADSSILGVLYTGSLGRGSAEFLYTVIICTAIVTGAYLVINRQMTLLGIPIMDRPLGLAQLLAFYALLIGISDPARKLSEVWNTLQRGMAAADRLYEALDREPKIVDPPHPKPLPSIRPDLVFENVAFAYQTGHPVLSDIRLTIPFGETVAIVGGLIYAFLPTPVEADLVEIERGTLRVTVDEDGKTRIHDKYVVSAPLNGRILRISMDPGDKVEAGKTLLTMIEPRDPELLDARSVAQAEARVKGAEATLRQVEPELEKVRAAQGYAEAELMRPTNHADIIRKLKYVAGEISAATSR